MLLNPENWFLIILGIVWIIGAVLQDLRRREVDNLWNFSLIAIALAYRLGVSAYTGNYWFAINGVLGFAIFLFLGNLFYYSRIFAGGDAKLMIALGAVLPLSFNWMSNFFIFGIFILLFLILGSVYVLVWSLLLVFENWGKFRKEFLSQVREYTILFLAMLIVGVGFVITVVAFGIFYMVILGFVILLFPLLFVFAKSVEESCMVRALTPRELTEGEWLYESIKVNGKTIKPSWEGVSASELKLIKVHYKKKILIKQGIPFTPGFLLGFIALLLIFWKFGAVFG